MSLIVYAMKATIPADSKGEGRIPSADIRYSVVDEWGELDVVVQSINGMGAVIPKGTGRGARAEVNEGLRDRAKVLALHHYFTTHVKYEFE